MHNRTGLNFGFCDYRNSTRFVLLLAGHAANRDADLCPTAAADKADRGGAADRGIGNQARELARVNDGCTVEADDDVAWFQSRAERRRVARQLPDDDARRVVDPKLVGELLRHRDETDATNPAAAHLSVLLEVRENPPREIARDGEADPLVATALREDHRVDADQLATRVDQRAARVARVDGGVGLHEVF